MTGQSRGTDPDRVLRNLDAVRDRIGRAARRSGRSPADVRLLAITKYVGPEAVRRLHAGGQRAFGESTVQGLEAKVEALGDLEGCAWHLVGHLQRNKVPKALRLAAAVHSLDSERLFVEIVAQSVRRGLGIPDLWVEVNTSGEVEKTGLSPEGLRPLLRLVRDDPRAGEAGPAPARIAGLMTMAPQSEDPDSPRAAFRALRALRDECVAEDLLPAGAGLSMGMSGDFEVAIEEGATVVRVGTALFEGMDTECRP